VSTAETIDDPMLARISDALGLYNSGRRAEARDAFAQLWAEVSDGDPFHQCILAHYMADAQDEPLDELDWDRKALVAADRISRERPDAASLTILSFYPSLHLNLADVLYRVGQIEEARKHLKQAQQSVDALTDDAYGQMIRGGIERLAARLQAAG
jgi:tetratricopeptide (TPR) repeat protein